MRRLFTTRHAGVSPEALRWGEHVGKWTRIVRGVYGDGAEPPSALDVARAEVLRKDAIAWATLAGVLHGLDSVTLLPRKPAERDISPLHVIELGGLRCANGIHTMIDLAAVLDDLTWEQALEAALRKRLTTIAELEDTLPALGRARLAGTARIRRVRGVRPPGAPPTESLLETLMVQLARTVPDLPQPTRQHEVYDEHGQFVARVDLVWLLLGLFIELDGQHHPGQPVYDARRETAVVAAAGWLCGRFTWTEVTRYPVSTARRLAALAERARQRPSSPRTYAA